MHRVCLTPWKHPKMLGLFPDTKPIILKYATVTHSSGTVCLYSIGHWAVFPVYSQDIHRLCCSGPYLTKPPPCRFIDPIVGGICCYYFFLAGKPPKALIRKGEMHAGLMTQQAYTWSCHKYWHMLLWYIAYSCWTFSQNWNGLRCNIPIFTTISTLIW